MSGSAAAHAGSPAAATTGASNSPATSAGAKAPSTPDAGAPPTDASAANSCRATLCEDFEASPTLDTAHWEIAMPSCTGTGKISLDATQSHSGSHSARVDGAGGYCNHVFLRPLAFPASDPLYVRFYVRMSTAFGQGHVTWLALRDDHEMHDLRMGGQSEILMWNRESDDATLPELSPTGIAASATPATNTWHCVEFAVDGKGAQLHTWLDSQPVAGLTVEGDATPDIDAQWQRKSDWHPQLSDVRFGWESYGGDANTLWFDDVAIASSRIGCMP